MPVAVSLCAGLARHRIQGPHTYFHRGIRVVSPGFLRHMENFGDTVLNFPGRSVLCPHNSRHIHHVSNERRSSCCCFSVSGPSSSSSHGNRFPWIVGQYMDRVSRNDIVRGPFCLLVSVGSNRTRRGCGRLGTSRESGKPGAFQEFCNFLQ